MLGSEYESMAREYGRLREEIKTRKWALENLAGRRPHTDAALDF